jgi:hypothetical protein
MTKLYSFISIEPRSSLALRVQCLVLTKEIAMKTVSVVFVIVYVAMLLTAYCAINAVNAAGGYYAIIK